MPTWPERISDVNIDFKDFRDGYYDDSKLRHVKLGTYLPPSLDYDVVIKGLHGGPEWFGGEHYIYGNKTYLIIPYNNTSWILRIKYKEENPIINNFVNKINFFEKGLVFLKNKISLFQSTSINIKDPNTIFSQSEWTNDSIGSKFGDFLYKYSNIKNLPKSYFKNCASCHRNDRSGKYQSEIFGDGYVPSLVGYTLTKKFQFNKANDDFIKLHKEIDIKREELDEIFKALHQYDKKLLKENKLKTEGFWQILLASDNLPLNKKPWGGVAIVDLNTGKKINDIIIGEMYDKHGISHKSSIIFGGTGKVNDNGHTFVTGTVDPNAYYISVKNGNIVEKLNLKRPGSVQPLLTNINQCEVWIFLESGGRFSFYNKMLNGFTVEAFKDIESCK